MRPIGTARAALPANQPRVAGRAANPSPVQIAFLADERGIYVRLPLTRGKFALVDVDDFEKASAAGGWMAVWNGCKYYAIDSRVGYLHRYILTAPDGLGVDHRNLDSLNCRRHNLRLATAAQNSANLPKQRRRATTSRFKGVNLHGGKWEARIANQGRRRHLGCFDSEVDAALAYDAAARELHGEFARLNFPDAGSSEEAA